jgi:hypothetical protein
VVRTATATLTPHTPDPTTDTTPTYQATAGNTAFPPGPGCNTLGGQCFRTPPAVNIARVASAEWNVDGGAFTTSGLAPTDGAFDEETDPYTFTPQSALNPGQHTFGTRSTNSFGHVSSTASDTLTISGASPPVCSPRPPVTVNASNTGSGRLAVTVATGATNVTLQRLEFGDSDFALIDIAGLTDRTDFFTVTLPAGTTSTSFTVRHNGSGTTHVPFTVVDSCGNWPTFVGGGANAF